MVFNRKTFLGDAGSSEYPEPGERQLAARRPLATCRLEGQAVSSVIIPTPFLLTYRISNVPTVYIKLFSSRSKEVFTNFAH